MYKCCFQAAQLSVGRYVTSVCGETTNVKNHFDTWVQILTCRELSSTAERVWLELYAGARKE